MADPYECMPRTAAQAMIELEGLQGAYDAIDDLVIGHLRSPGTCDELEGVGANNLHSLLMILTNHFSDVTEFVRETLEVLEKQANH